MELTEYLKKHITEAKKDNNSEYQITTLSQLKKGTYFKFKGQKRVYIFDGGGPKKGFDYTAADDISDYKNMKKDKEIEIGFDY